MHNLNYHSTIFHLNETLKEKLKQKVNSVARAIARWKENRGILKNI